LLKSVVFNIGTKVAYSKVNKYIRFIYCNFTGYIFSAKIYAPSNYEPYAKGVIMGLVNYHSSKSMVLAKAALDYRSMRQDMIASNIANVDTPNYKPRDISFESSLRTQQAKLFNQTPKLEMAVTDTKHIPLSDTTSSCKATTFFRDGHMARNDGNSVDLDIETTEMSKNSVMYNGLLAAIKKEAMIFRSVIEASQKVN